jgi:hypothetical protein
MDRALDRLGGMVSAIALFQCAVAGLFTNPVRNGER